MVFLEIFDEYFGLNGIALDEVGAEGDVAGFDGRGCIGLDEYHDVRRRGWAGARKRGDDIFGVAVAEVLAREDDARAKSTEEFSKREKRVANDAVDLATGADGGEVRAFVGVR